MCKYIYVYIVICICGIGKEEILDFGKEENYYKFEEMCVVGGWMC